MRWISLGVAVVSVIGLPYQAGSQEPPVSAAPEDKPFAMGFACSPDYLALIDPCVVTSRQTFAQARERFLAGLPEGYALLVVMMLRDPSGSVEQSFVQVHQIDGLSIFGSVASEMMSVRGFEHGDRVALSEREILDWVIVSRDGREEGNIVGKYLDLLQEGKVRGKCSSE